MRIAIVIEDGLKQLVLTPESDHEKACLKQAGDEGISHLTMGQYYHCQGGWTRQGSGNDSLILVLKDRGKAA